MHDAHEALYRWRFGSAEFDEARFELRVGGLAVDVQQKPLQLLALLLANAGEVVARDTLMAAVWGDRVTVDNVLANAVSKLRAALGDANGDCIVTVPRKGYRLAAAAERVAVGRRLESRLALAPGAPVPGREAFVLATLLGSSQANETWLARHAKSGDARVYKFAVDAERLGELKREVTVHRLLHAALGERDGFVRVLDWNFEQPPLFLACEYAGQRLDEWAAAPAAAVDAQPNGTRLAALPQPARLALFLQAADAVAAAHGVGVLHRDLKPANLLVQRRGDDGWVLRVADFGSATLLDTERLQALRITQLGMTQPAGSGGTPYYLAPELANGEPPGVRADVYALGVVLYQLLAGDLRRQLAPGWERDIDDALLRADVAAATDVEPSLRLGSVGELTDRLRTLAARRGQRAAQQAADAALQQALQRQARAALRRPWLVGSAAVVVAALAAVAAGWALEHRAGTALRHELVAATALNRLLSEGLVDAAQPTGGPRTDISLVEALKIAAAGIDTRFAEQPAAVRARLHARLQQALAALGWPREAAGAGRRALAAWARAAADDAAAPAAALLDVRLQLAADLAADDAAAAAAVLAAAEHDAGPPTARGPLLRARLAHAAWLVAGGGTVAPALRTAWAQAASAGALEQPWGGAIALSLAEALVRQGAAADAEAVARQLLVGLPTRQQGGGNADHSLLAARTTVALVRALAAQGRDADALPLLPDMTNTIGDRLGLDHPTFIDATDLSARVRFRVGDFAGAARHWARVRDGWLAAAGDGSSLALSAQARLALARHHAERAADAEPMLRDALARARLILDDDTPPLQSIRWALADCLLDRGGTAEAAGLLAGIDAASLASDDPAPGWPERLAAQRLRALMPAAAGGVPVAAATAVMARAAPGR